MADLDERALEQKWDVAMEILLLEAKRECPVRTGALRDSLFVGRDGENRIIDSPLDYFPHVVFGHVTSLGTHVAPNRFLDRALESARPALRRLWGA